MDAEDLAVFAAVARTGGITKAAQILNTVQSNVTQRIRLLEDELGVPLFHRHSRGVTLTSAGSQLLPYAERIRHLVGEARQAAIDGPTPRGKIVIGALETATALRLPPILAAYAASYPQVEIEVSTGTTAGLIQTVLSHQMEAAFVAGPVNHPELVTIQVIEEELMLVTAPWVLDLDRMFSTITADKLKIIVFRSGCAYRARLENLLATRGIVGVRRLDFGTLDGILGCVGAGVGITLLPRAVVASVAEEGRVAAHTLPPDEARVPTVVIRHRDAFVSTALARFIELARAHLATPSTERQETAPGRFRAAGPLPPPVQAASNGQATAQRRRYAR
jgi:LysR family transcriptional regulator, cell division regulator